MSPERAGQAPASGSASQGADRSTTEWERARRRAEVFGEVLPEITRDERDEGGRGERRDGDTWLREQVPPHHGG
ncbi:hypothetical protein [Nocardioides marmotae]|uniref:Uncharacterized protein n=1 Tax=Nocardioides marmotae TaxID=2663857 RepID=A0A6I3IXN4_9ACTN|nr:hypothetical protein [Nocardioides marmotae]MCR6030225.1 hypothetical protein [Gordonia jinghuaiqii]MBC9734484.1 hypothetical protein [Nocardioides marmotae]MTB85584.1 hypothetical protein [Nocardioides marmotae]MTB93857.1 hypothetical protein [Nocardioides marmotae]QKE00182.1 hypothetical protein HPC71_03135 [Nocardioides marmotae]